MKSVRILALCETLAAPPPAGLAGGSCVPVIVARLQLHPTSHSISNNQNNNNNNNQYNNNNRHSNGNSSVNQKEKQKDDRLSLRLSDASAALPAVLSPEAAASLATSDPCDIVVWKWSTTVTLTTRDSRSSGNDDDEDHRSIFISAAAPVASCPSLAFIASYHSDVTNDELSSPTPPIHIITDKHQPPPSPKSTLISVSGPVLAKSPLRVRSPASASFFVRIANAHSPFASSKSITLLLAFPSVIHAFIARSALAIGTTIECSNLRLKQLSLRRVPSPLSHSKPSSAPRSNLVVLVNDPKAASSIIITGFPPDVPLYDPPASTHLHESPTSIIPHLSFKSIFSSLHHFRDSDWTPTTISYSGTITSVVDAALGIHILDNEFVLVSALGSLGVADALLLQSGAAVRLADVHLIVGPPSTPVFLVLCPASTIDLVAFGPQHHASLTKEKSLTTSPITRTTTATNTTSENAAPIPSDLDRTMSFADLAIFISLRSMFMDMLTDPIPNHLTPRVCNQSSPTDRQSAATSLALALLIRFGHTASHLSLTQRFLYHDTACNILDTSVSLPCFVTVQDVSTRMDAAITRLSNSVSSATTRGAVLHCEVPLSNRDSKPCISCVGWLLGDVCSGRLVLCGGGSTYLCVDVVVEANLGVMRDTDISTAPKASANATSTPSTTTWDGISMLGHLVIISNMRLMCEVILDDVMSAPGRGEPTDRHHAPCAVFKYIQVHAFDIFDLGSFGASRIVATPSSMVPATATASASVSAPVVPETTAILFVPHMIRAPLLRFVTPTEPCIETVVSGVAIVLSSSSSSNAGPHQTIPDAYIQFYGDSAHLGELMTIGSRYRLDVPVPASNDFVSQAVLVWERDWGIRLDDPHTGDDNDSASCRDRDILSARDPLPLAHDAAEPTTGMYVRWCQTLVRLQCRVLSRRTQKEPTSLHLSTDIFTNTTPRVHTDMVYDSAAQYMSQRMLIGIGRDDMTLVIEVECVQTGDRISVFCDCRTRGYPFGLIPGRMIELDGIAIKPRRNGGLYTVILPSTCIREMSTRDHRVVTGGGSDIAGVGRERRLLRLCSMFSEPLRAHSAYVDVTVVSVARVIFTLVCFVCGQMRTKESIDSGCASGCDAVAAATADVANAGDIKGSNNPENRDTPTRGEMKPGTDTKTTLRAEVTLFAQDGTSEASITFTGVDTVTSLLLLRPADRDRLQSYLNDIGCVEYASRAVGSVTTSPMDHPDATAATTWLSAICHIPRLRRRLRVLVDVRPNAVAALLASGGSRLTGDRQQNQHGVVMPSKTCPVDLSQVRPRTLYLGNNHNAVDTVAHKSIRLRASGFVELDARMQTRELLARLDHVN